MERIDLTPGDEFGRLTILGIAKMKYRKWSCQCICGKILAFTSWQLRSGRVISCGCKHKEDLKRGLARMHGECSNGRQSPEYSTWNGIINRCCNPNNTMYRHYGGRGIKVCSSWRKSFRRFLKDMGRKPTPKHEIDRIDNDGDYEPSNCRWATRSQQLRNTRRSHYVTMDGVTKTLADWSDELNLPYDVVRTRAKRNVRLDNPYKPRKR